MAWFSHPRPSSAWMYSCIRQKTNVTPRKFDNNLGNVAGILWTAISRAISISKKSEPDSRILTSIPLCCRPSKAGKPRAFSWAAIFIERHFRFAACAFCERHQFIGFKVMNDTHLRLMISEWLKIWRPVHRPETKLAFLSDFEIFIIYMASLRGSLHWPVI